jgi:hypothetical protein
MKMMKLILKDIISGFHKEIREGSCREQLPFFYWKWKMKTLQPGTVSRLQEKSLAAFHAAFSLFRCDQYQRNRGNQNCPGIIMGINPIPRIKVMVHPAPVIMLQLLSNTI